MGRVVCGGSVPPSPLIVLTFGLLLFHAIMWDWTQLLASGSSVFLLQHCVIAHSVASLTTFNRLQISQSLQSSHILFCVIQIVTHVWLRWTAVCPEGETTTNWWPNMTNILTIPLSDKTCFIVQTQAVGWQLYCVLQATCVCMCIFIFEIPGLQKGVVTTYLFSFLMAKTSCIYFSSLGPIK